jgi:hypothetical protein
MHVLMLSLSLWCSNVPIWRNFTVIVHNKVNKFTGILNYLQLQEMNLLINKLIRIMSSNPAYGKVHSIQHFSLRSYLYLLGWFHFSGGICSWFLDTNMLMEGSILISFHVTAFQPPIKLKTNRLFLKSSFLKQ